MSARALIERLSYRRGFPFIASVILAVATAAWPRLREALFHQGTSIWTMAVFAAVSTAFALLCGGRFRTFFIAIAVMPPFLLVLPSLLRSAIRHPEYPIRGLVEYVLFCVAAPLILVWLFAMLFNRESGTDDRGRSASPAS